LRIALVVPPTVNLNTPYAAVPRLAGWLRHLGHEVVPVDLSLELFLRVFSRDGLARMFADVDPSALGGDTLLVYRNRDQYLHIIDDAVAVLQLRDLSATARIVRGGMIPLGPRTANLRASPGAWGETDFARYRVSVMLLELMDFFRVTVSGHFGLTDYAAQLVEETVSFDPIANELARTPSAYHAMLAEVCAERFPAELDLVGITCPFPGNLIGALLVGKWLAAHRPNTRRALGGGYPSTALREMSDPRVFDYTDYVVLDDGELPLQQICARLQGRDEPLHDTFIREAGRVTFQRSEIKPLAFSEYPTPSYAGLSLDRYVHMVYVSSPLQRANDGPWLKLTAAHGCYWKQCTFCDIHLPYIADYDPMPAARIADQMDALHAETGRAGFHFTDEAAPPALLVNLALELLRRGRNYHWWGNIRYDSAFEPDRCRLLAAAGMMLVTGGIEVASDAVLAKIVKGVSVVQLIKVLQAMTDAGIATHAYLIYGFPGETVQDTINALEIIRQLMSARLLDNGVYHQLSVTAHSPLGRRPELFGVRLRLDPPSGFARNYLPFAYSDGVPRSRAMHEGLSTALDNFRRQMYLDSPLREWFPGLTVPDPTVEPDFVARTMQQPHPGARLRDRLCWLGGEATWARGQLTVRAASGELCTLTSSREVAENLNRCHPKNWRDARPPARQELASPADWFETLRPYGLVLV
jgi:radical SAM superfamily enzyme YgiQ (UPF0313 family)